MNPDSQEVTIFMFEWTVSTFHSIFRFIISTGFFQEYYINLAKQLGVKGKSSPSIGKYLQRESLEKLRDEQIVQLHELYKTAKGLDEEDNKQ